MKEIYKKYNKSSYISEGYITNDMNGNCNFQFSIDLGTILSNLSATPELISTIKEVAGAEKRTLDHDKSTLSDVLAFSRIKDISITRQEINPHSISLAAAPSIKSHNHVAHNSEQIIVSSTQMDVGSPVMTNVEEYTSGSVTTKIGAIKEINDLYMPTPMGTMASNRFRHFSVTDYSLRKSSGGTYQYSVDLEIVDGSKLYLKQKLSQLEEDLEELKRYHSHMVDGATVGIKPDQSFMRGKNGPWVYATASLIDFLKIFNANPTSKKTKTGGTEKRIILPDDLEKKLYILISPKTASKYTIKAFLNTYEKILTILRNKVITAGITTSSQDSKVSGDIVAGSGGKTSSNTFTVKIKLSSLFNSRLNRGDNYDYLGISTSENNIGLNIITEGLLNTRTKDETLKYFNPAALSSGLMVDNANFKDDLAITKWSYLTPAAISIPGQTFKTYTINENGEIETPTEKEHTEALMSVYTFEKTELPPAINKRITKEKEAAAAKNELAEQLMHIVDALSLSNTSVEFDFAPLCSLDEDEKILDSDILSSAEVKLMNREAEEENFNNTVATTQININNRASPHASSALLSIVYQKDFEISKDISNLANGINPSSKQFVLKTAISRKSLPNQLKALMMSSLGSDSVRHQWFDEQQNTTLKDLNTSAIFNLNHKNLVSVEVCNGISVDNIKTMKWTLLTPSTMDDAIQSGSKYLLCRLKPYKNKVLSFDTDKILKLPILNKYFLLDLDTQVITAGNQMAPIATSLGRLETLDANPLLGVGNAFAYTNINPVTIPHLSVQAGKTTQSAQTDAPDISDVGQGSMSGQGRIY